MRKIFCVLVLLCSMFFMLSCGGGSTENTPAQDGDAVSDEDAVTDEDQTDTENTDTDDTGDTVDDTSDTEEPDGDTDSGDNNKKQGELYGRCYPNKTCNEGLECDEENDTCIKKQKDDSDTSDTTDDTDTSDTTDDSDSDTSDTGTTDNDIPGGDNDNETPDNDTPENLEATENHKISGSYQIGSNVSGIETALYECGGTEKIAYGNTDTKGKYSFNAAISATKTYCVKAGDFASCFIGMSDHTANISEITNAVALVNSDCSDLRAGETKIRKYAKLGTGEWLGELDYSKLSGIKEGLKLLSNYLNTTNSKTLSSKIAEDAKKETPEFAKFFNGFRVFADKAEIIIGETSDSSANFAVEGGSTKVAQGFKIQWTLKNKSAEAAVYKFTTSAPGEYVARAKLVYSGTTLSDDSTSVLFLQRKSGGTVYLNNKSKNISFRIDDGIYGVIPKNTVVKKNGSPVNSISYDVLSAGGNQVSRLKFYPEGAVFEGDTMYFVHELGTVFGGDPIMLSAKRTNANGTVDVLNSAAGDPIMMAAAGDPIMTTAAGDPIMQAAAGDPIMTSAAGDPIMTAAAGDPIMTSAAGDPIMTSAAGDPIMSAAAGDPIMTSAAGDPIMTSAAGDPIMMGTSSSAMISQTGHYSTFTVEAASLPVSVEAMVARWCDGSFYRGYSPLEFIKKGVTDNNPESTLLPYLTCEKFGDLGNDLYELMNKQIGFQRNLNLFENLFFVNEFYNRMNAKRESGAVAAVKNGLELRSAIAALYTATTSYNRSTTLAYMFDSSMIPLTYSGVIPEDYTSKAKSAVTGNSDSGDKYTATKKEMMIFANYITTSSKGPDFNNVSSVLNPDQLVCAWFNPDTPAQNCNKVYTINDAGHVTLGGTEVSVAEANAIFTKYFMPMNSRLSDSEKLDLFRTLYLALKYAGTIFYNGSDIEELNGKLLKTAYLVFDGIDGNAKAVSIVDSFDASAHTVQVLDGNEMATRPYIQKLSTLTDQISLKVAASSADVEKVLISIEGKEFEKVQENTRTYYKQTGDLKEKSIILTPGTLSQGEKALKDLLGSENVDSLGNITGKMTIVANSKISNKTYSTQKTYEFFVNNDGDGVNSKEVPADLEIFVNDSTGHPVPDNANPMIILNPGNKVYYPVDGRVSIENLTPAAYTVDAFADGYYAKSTSVNVPAGAAFSVEIRLDEELTSTADASLELSVTIDTAKHPSKVYIQIYNDDMELVANEAAKFSDETGTYKNVNIEINSGRYTLLAVGEELYNYLEAITLYEGANTKEIKVVAKNACGNGIVDSAEECEPALAAPVSCGTIYPASTHPEKTATCDPNTCTFDKQECGKAAYCGDGILDAGEGCDGGAKDCSEIAGFGNSRGTAPCKNDDCSGYITANNCTRTTASCGTLPANAQWNDGEGTFAQTYDGTDWAPTAKAANYGLTTEECTSSCTKGYKWSGSQCLESPLSLALVCTGETDCFDSSSATECPAYGEAFFGQDAQYAENGYCTKHDFTTSGSGDNQIVKDKFTHYEWQAVSSGNVTWSEAETYCSRLENGSSTAVWRVPTPAELLTIVDSSNASPALDNNYFTVSGHTFWASEDKKNTENAWRIDENGALTSVAKTESHHVLCVRVNDYDATENRFTATDETVKDNESGLMWQKQAVASRTWAEALNYCEEVSMADKFDWRLPNRNELASLVDYTKANGTMSDFPSIAAKGFWASTTDINAASKAWTVDFADGSIKSADKTDTKYIICVRNDEPCFGDECADPCGFAPCKNMANSTGLCTAGDYDFTCGCKSGFNWNHAKCLLDTTRYVACDGLPENASGNTFFGISQTYDGDKWYPSNIGTFNKISSNVECRFVCATNYKWDADEEKCLPVSRVANCSEKKPYSDWNVVYKISQTWDGEKWEPSAESEYNPESSEEECRFVCKEHYNWDSENNLCDPERQPAACTGLPANAVWNSATIEQTWNGTSWAPTATGTHTTGNATDKCYFKCIDEGDKYEWKNGACSAKPKTAQCAGLPDNAEWTGGYSSITQTWNGSEWFPGNAGTYNTEINSAYCRFKCLANYNWNGSTCEPRTQIVTCGTLPANAVWNTVSQIRQTWNGSEYTPAVNLIYSETSSESECRYTCKENYEFKNDACVAKKQTVACTGLPANAIWNSTTVVQEWNGTTWAPETTGTHTTGNATDRCYFKCIDENVKFDWDTTTSTCKGHTNSNVACNNNSIPANASWWNANINQTWSGTEWLPTTTGSFSNSAVDNQCRFKCNSHYSWNGATCEAETKISSCGTLPANAEWNTASSIEQHWDESASGFTPTLTPEYGTEATTAYCRFKCKENYEWKNGSCQAKTKTVACTGLPANAVWRTSSSGTGSSFSITQRWSGTEWTPSTTGTHGSFISGQCRFTCADEGYKFKWENNACLPNTITDQECEGLPDNAEWTGGFSTISQTWNPATNSFEHGLWATFATEADSAYCHFKCKENYTWTGLEDDTADDGECVADTRKIDCKNLPENAVWNYVPTITQTWDGREWLPKLEPKYNVVGSEDECRYICDAGYYPLDGQCVGNPCSYSPCSGIDYASGTCLENGNLLLSYACECSGENYWWGKTGCRSQNAALGNLCTGTIKCFNNGAEIGCPESSSGTGENYNFYGQDAYYAEAGFCAPKNFSLIGSEPYTITVDNATGLMWTKNPSDYQGVSAARTYCSELSYGGETGWRLPSIKELMTIFDNSMRNPAVDTKYFNIEDDVWSTTPFVSDSEVPSIWIFDSDNGYVGAMPTLIYTAPAICVKGTMTENPVFGTIAGTNAVVKDSTTELYWQKGYATDKTWQGAIEYCENLTLGEYSDWRLPNYNELASIIDFTRKDPAVNTTYLSMPTSETEYFWTSTTRQDSSDKALAFDFKSGAPKSSIVKSELNYVRCVRSDICGEGKFLSGKNCIDTPCTSSSCSSVSYSDGICTPLTESKYSCGCVDGYTWESSTSSCIPDPCITDNECVSMEGSDGICTPDDGKIKCGCVDGYFWNGSRCMKKVFGNICTGLQQCYNATKIIACPETENETFFGQDAYYASKGVCTPQSFILKTPYSTKPDEKVVLDENTKLEWQRTISGDTYTFYQAITHCANLEYAGYDDWRLPTTKELASIMLQSSSGRVNTDYFVAGTGSRQFWTSKRYVSDTNKAWTINFGSSTTNVTERETGEALYAICVRGEILPESSFTTFTKNGDSIIKDNVTGLMWQYLVDEGDWSYALNYCESSTYGGYTDWRLPNFNELLSIVNYDRYTPTTDIPSITEKGTVWSSTNSVSSSGARYSTTISFKDGGQSMTRKTYSSYVLCVR